MKKLRPLHLFCLTVLCILLMAGCAKKPVSEPLETQSQAPAKNQEPSDAIEQTIIDLQPVQNADVPEIVFERVHFAFDKYSLSPEARSILSHEAVVLQSSPDLKVRIEGHCDDHGSDEYNLVLGERRAQAVRAYLVTLGVEPERLGTVSYGEEMPVDMSRNEMARAKNRRAEFKVLN
jgi:peptidoglycan-associated lipoprotein